MFGMRRSDVIGLRMPKEENDDDEHDETMRAMYDIGADMGAYRVGMQMEGAATAMMRGIASVPGPGALETAAIFITDGANPNDGIDIATRSANVDMLALLVEAGGKLNARSYGFAIESGSVECVEMVHSLSELARLRQLEALCDYVRRVKAAGFVVPVEMAPFLPVSFGAILGPDGNGAAPPPVAVPSVGAMVSGVPLPLDFYPSVAGYDRVPYSVLTPVKELIAMAGESIAVPPELHGNGYVCIDRAIVAKSLEKDLDGPRVYITPYDTAARIAAGRRLREYPEALFEASGGKRQPGDDRPEDVRRSEERLRFACTSIFYGACDEPGQMFAWLGIDIGMDQPMATLRYRSPLEHIIKTSTTVATADAYATYVAQSAPENVNARILRFIDMVGDTVMAVNTVGFLMKMNYMQVTVQIIEHISTRPGSERFAVGILAAGVPAPPDEATRAAFMNILYRSYRNMHMNLRASGATQLGWCTEPQVAVSLLTQDIDMYAVSAEFLYDAGVATGHAATIQLIKSGVGVRFKTQTCIFLSHIGNEQARAETYGNAASGPAPAAGPLRGAVLNKY